MFNNSPMAAAFVVVSICIAGTTGCGKKEPAPSTAVMDAYFGKTYRSECLPMSSDDVMGLPSRVSTVPSGHSFTEIHRIAPITQATPESGELAGRLHRVVYHDANCVSPMLTVTLDHIVGKYKSTPTGIELSLSPNGSVTPHDAIGCQFLSDMFEWERSADTKLRRICEVGMDYQRSDWVLFQRHYKPTAEGIPMTRLHYELKVQPGGADIEVRGPQQFFKLMTDLWSDVGGEAGGTTYTLKR